MKTVADPRVLRSLKDRLGALRVDSRRRWGTLTPHEMLCHLGDATAMVLGVRPRKVPARKRRRMVLKSVVLWTALPWPRGWPTNPFLNPKADGTSPSDFSRDRGGRSKASRRSRGLRPIPLIPRTGCLVRCRSLIGSGGHTATRITTCVSSACEDPNHGWRGPTRSPQTHRQRDDSKWFPASLT